MMLREKQRGFFGAKDAVPPPNSKESANSHDEEWQAEWVANAKTILASVPGQNEGMFVLFGDSLSRTPWIGEWAIGGNGKTAEDIAICNWMHAGEAPQDLDTLDGFYLQAPVKTTPPQGGYHCSNRSYTIGDGLGAWSYMDAGPMPDETDQTAARAILNDCASYPNDLNLVTILAAINKPQFAMITVKVPFQTPGVLPSGYIAMYDALETAGIVPIVTTETYRRVYNDDPGAGNTTEDWMDAIDIQNDVRRTFAQTREFPLIDLQLELESRRPVLVRSDIGLRDAWSQKYLPSGDGVHLTGTGYGGYLVTDDPYADGGDPAVHQTGAALTYSGYGLKGWLLVQKMKQLKELVVDAA